MWCCASYCYVSNPTVSCRPWKYTKVICMCFFLRAFPPRVEKTEFRNGYREILTTMVLVKWEWSMYWLKHFISRFSVNQIAPCLAVWLAFLTQSLSREKFHKTVFTRTDLVSPSNASQEPLLNNEIRFYRASNTERSQTLRENHLSAESFPCTLLLKYTKVLSNHFLRNFKKYKIVLPESSY